MTRKEAIHRKAHDRDTCKDSPVETILEYRERTGAIYGGLKVQSVAERKAMARMLQDEEDGIERCTR